MEEVTIKIVPGYFNRDENIRFPMLTNEKYVDRIIKNLRRRNINHYIRHTVGGYKSQICINVGHSEIYFWTIDLPILGVSA